MEKLEKMELLVKTKLVDEEVSDLLGKMVENDKEEKNFELERYMKFYDYFNEMGKMQMDCWKTEETLGKFYESLMVVRAVVKFKKGIKR